MARASWNGAILAESDDCQIVDGNHYFPPQSIKKPHFRPSETHSTCPWKGEASYYTIEVDGRTNKDAAWYYPRTPSPPRSTSRATWPFGRASASRPDPRHRVSAGSCDCAQADPGLRFQDAARFYSDHEPHAETVVAGIRTACRYHPPVRLPSGARGVFVSAGIPQRRHPIREPCKQNPGDSGRSRGS